MAGTTLTKQQASKVAAAVATVKGLPKDEKGKKNVERFADKYARYALGVRGTGPHAHGLNKTQRSALYEAIRSALGIKAKPAAAKKNSGGKAAPKKGGKRSTRKSTAQLAKEQQARAEGK